MGGSSSKVNDPDDVVIEPVEPDLEKDDVIKPVEPDDEYADTLDHQFLSWSWFI